MACCRGKNIIFTTGGGGGRIVSARSCAPVKQRKGLHGLSIGLANGTLYRTIYRSTTACFVVVFLYRLIQGIFLLLTSVFLYVFFFSYLQLVVILYVCLSFQYISRTLHLPPLICLYVPTSACPYVCLLSALHD